jgi:hypothetical protein
MQQYLPADQRHQTPASAEIQPHYSYLPFIDLVIPSLLLLLLLLLLNLFKSFHRLQRSEEVC